jgi:signal recognition particle subunit SRP54
MFEGLQDKFQDVFRRLKGEGRITEEHLAAALKQIRLALLEADVHFRVVKEFLARVEEKALGEKVLESLSPAQQVIKIVRDELAATLGGEDARELRTDGTPAVILMCGLQGSGKTTTCGKLAKRLAARGRYPLLVAADLQRAAAVEQLVQVGARVDIPVLKPEAGEKVVDLARRSLREARERGRDVVILDTAGRLHVDQELMAEIGKIAETVSPDEVLYVADSMTGQDAVRSPRSSRAFCRSPAAAADQTRRRRLGRRRIVGPCRHPGADPLRRRRREARGSRALLAGTRRRGSSAWAMSWR